MNTCTGMGTQVRRETMRWKEKTSREQCPTYDRKQMGALREK